jgi:hypothetical protein
MQEFPLRTYVSLASRGLEFGQVIAFMSILWNGRVGDSGPF